MFGNLRGAKRTRNTAISHDTKRIGFAAAVMPLMVVAAMAASLFAAPTPASAFELPDVPRMVMNLFAAPVANGADGDTVADAPTINGWRDAVEENNTRTVGRIWTDKTVQTGDITLEPSNITVSKDADADFLVGLSALSSTSNTLTTSSKPLDIVLLFDVSGSMNNRIGGRGSKSKMEALKDAIDSFIDSTNTENAKINDNNLKHRISLVKFAADEYRNSIGDDTYTEFFNRYNYTQVVSDFSFNANVLKADMNGIDAGGATSADYGFTQAKRVIDGDSQYGLGGARDNAQKVIIFFTDGEPNHGSGFDTSVATSAIEKAGEFKGDDVLIYSVGVVDDADPDANINLNNDESINAYLHSVSSNYPDAKGWQRSSGWRGSWVMGDRAEDTQGENSYYKTATDAEGLNSVFQDIFASISQGVSSPTEVTKEGFGGANDGYITFTDKLGDWMTVKGDTMTVVFANETFTGERQEDGSFAFEGEVTGNPVYPEANLGNLKVTVEPGANGAGDIVTVKIPAQLIPLRNYSVETENGKTTMTTAEAFPIRVFYNVGMQEGAQDKLANPDEAMKSYIAANKGEDGLVGFYSNSWTRSKTTGDTTATFMPAKTNKFYYFTTPTALYKDEGCTQLATKQDLSGDGFVYYRNDYFVQQADGSGEAKLDKVAIPKTAFQSGGVHASNYTEGSDGYIYMKEGVARLNRTNDFQGDKANNATGTATQSISPAWNEGKTGIVVSLGNNGKLVKELPATLAVSKTVEAADGFDAADYAQTSFPFTIEVADAANGDYKAAVASTSAEGEATAKDATVTFTDGKATYSLKHGQTLTIYGLPAGANYTVTEDLSNIKGFTQEAQNNSGTLTAGVTATAAFTNTYKADAAMLPAEWAVSVEKELSGREWRDTDEFTFTITPRKNTDAPAFEPSTLTIKGTDAQHTGTFDSVTFDKPGTYQYRIAETEGSILGIDYSYAKYRLTVVVEDNAAEGKLVVKSATLVQTHDDANNAIEGGKTATVAQFTNKYDAEKATVEPKVVKKYTNNSGDLLLEDGMFEAVLTAVGGYKTDGGSAENPTIDAVDVPIPDGAESNAVKVKNSGGYFEFSEISFDGDDAGNTYIYKVTETNPGIANMKYDKKEHIVTVKVTEDSDGDKTVIKAESSPAEGVTLTNVYTPDSVVLSSDTAIFGTKTLTGRDAKEGENFTFKLVPTGTTLDAIKAGTVTGISDKGLTATVENAENGVKNTFRFGDITFTKVGSYTFAMSEDAPAKDGNGMTYDRHTCTVTVKVTLDKESGKLEANTTYSQADGGNNFTNTYEASLGFGAKGGVAAAKTLMGRYAAANEFWFTVTGADADSTVKMVEGEESFGNIASAPNQPAVAKKLFSGVTFTQADADKTFTYTVKEVVPEKETDKLPGVTYDESIYTVAIKVTDNGDGTMKAVTTVTDADGKQVSSADTSADDYKAPTVSFVNRYKAADATQTLTGITKVLAGDRTPGLQADEFSFTMSVTPEQGSPADGFTMPDGLNPATAKNAADGSVMFGDITFTKAGSYRVTVKENVPAKDEGAPFMKYDGHSYTYTVKVTDDGNGQLQTSILNERGGKTFTNTYNPAEDTKDVSYVDAPETSVNGQMVGVGDELVYTIKWVNDAVNEQGQSVAAEVVVTDTLPQGVEFVSATEGGTESDGVVTWSLGEQAAGATGTVTVTVKVTEDAVTVDSIQNTASIQLGDHDLKTTNTAEVFVPEKTVEDGTPDTGIQVGDTLTYTIEWANATSKVAAVTVTDTLPAGLTYVEGSANPSDGFKAEGNKLTWNLGEQAAGKKGTVSFKAKVNEAALVEGVGNKASVQVGDNPAVNTNTTPGEVKTGSLTISKTVEVDEAQGTEVDTDKEFSFKVELTDTSGAALTGSYAYTGSQEGKIASGDTVTLKHSESITIEGLPEGAGWTVTEDTEGLEGYTPVQKDGKLSGSIASGADAENTAAFVNKYNATAAEGVPANFSLTKVLEGKDWDGDEFTFQLTAKSATASDGTAIENIPLPADCEKTLSEPTDENKAGNDIATFDFGGITFTQAGTYVYEVEEDEGSNLGITYSDNIATVTVQVEDNGKGALVATATVQNETFTNVYRTGEVAFDAAGGLNIVKKLTGRSIGEGDFTFTMTGADKASIEKLGGGEKTFTTKGTEIHGNVATETVTALTGLEFGQADIDKTYAYTVTEKNGGVDGYTYDPAEHKVEFKVSDGTNGTLIVDVYVDGDFKATYSGAVTRAASEPVTVEFKNTYKADPTTVGGEGDATFRGTKTLTGRDMVAGEFTFNVTDKNGKVVSTGKNAKDGTVTFKAIEYTTESLNTAVAEGAATRTETEAGDVYEFGYTVAEDTTALDEGVSVVQGSFSVTVNVTDDGKGTLTSEVTLPDGGLAFKNAYGEGEVAELGISGKKVLDVESGDNAPTLEDIAGKYTFKLEGSEGAPMPEKTEVQNDAAGNIGFGTIEFTMENVFGEKGDVDQTDVELASKLDVKSGGAEPAGDDVKPGEAELLAAQRAKTFTYIVSESGDVPGITNDPESKTITVTVTDDGKGNLTVEKDTQGADFTFTNTYSVDPTDPVSPTDPEATGGITLTKALIGRDLVEGEFSFALRDAEGETVSTGANAADGSVTLPGITFSAPGAYSYTLAEVAPEGNVQDGVTYDGAIYNVVATVTDNGDGTLSVAWRVTDAEDKAVDAVTFENEYEAAPTGIVFNAAKKLDGRELVEGEFSFELREDGKVIATAENDAEGKVAFERIEYAEAGEHSYEIVEVKGDAEGVTYDETVFTATVSVVDDGKGHLTVPEGGWSYGENGAPVFRNTYVAPAEPVEPKPEEPAEPAEKLPTTGDDTLLAVGGVGAAAVALIGVGLVLNRRKQR